MIPTETTTSFEPDSFYRGLRINQAGNLTWQICLDDKPTPHSRFTILVHRLASREAAERTIDKLIAALLPEREAENATFKTEVDAWRTAKAEHVADMKEADAEIARLREAAQSVPHLFYDMDMKVVRMIPEHHAQHDPAMCSGRCRFAFVPKGEDE